ncbi:MAG: DNA-directed RNA polymerase subunit L [Alteromonadaceae bacterium]
MALGLYYGNRLPSAVIAKVMMTIEPKYPLGIQTFSEIREEDYLYVDKTVLIYKLITTGKVYFLSRPRRFGKSLLISTLDALFSGQKTLFDDLAIADTNYDFTAYPVIKLEFSQDEFTTANSVRDYICSALKRTALEHQIELTENTYNQRFAELIRKLHKQTGQKVVLLIDEYDKPILNNLNKPVLSEIKQVMVAFYCVVKPLDEHIKFVLITGVSKFAKVSVFSGMNSLTDISMDRRFTSLCGVTQQELESVFTDQIDELAELDSLERTQLLSKIKHWYNGYRFHHRAVGVYNPYSLLSLFLNQEFKNYWYTTATPTFLLNLLQEKQYDLRDLTQFEIGDNAFAVCEPEDIDILSVFVQTGYLTIKSYSDPLYTLDFPNHEVKKSFFDSVVGRYGYLNSSLGQGYTHKLIQYLNSGALTHFFATLEKFFANVPYDLAIDLEKYYQSLFYAIFTLIGLDIEAEVRTNKGRIDCVLQTQKTIYIIEFKLNDSKEAALKQIQDKQYAQKYQNSDKEIVLLGVEFDQTSRNIGGFIQQVLA